MKLWLASTIAAHVILWASGNFTVHYGPVTHWHVQQCLAMTDEEWSNSTKRIKD